MVLYFFNAYSTKIVNISNFVAMDRVVLYIHGMGGGSDSRIPSILRDVFLHPAKQLPSIEGAALGYNPLRGSTFASPSFEDNSHSESNCTSESLCHPEQSEGSSKAVTARVKVVARTYDFDPEVAAKQIGKWVEELKPDLVIGESLGSMQAIRVTGVPHLFVSPSLNAPFVFGHLAWMSLIPGVTWLLDRIYKPREGDRQPLHFTFKTLRKYRQHRREALKNTTLNGSKDYFFAFFGTRDHYRRYGIVTIRSWEKYFGKTYQIYEGTHFMEEEHINALLVPKICEILNVSL